MSIQTRGHGAFAIEWEPHQSQRKAGEGPPFGPEKLVNQHSKFTQQTTMAANTYTSEGYQIVKLDHWVIASLKEFH